MGCTHSVQSPASEHDKAPDTYSFSVIPGQDPGYFPGTRRLPSFSVSQRAPTTRRQSSASTHIARALGRGDSSTDDDEDVAVVSYPLPAHTLAEKAAQPCCFATPSAQLAFGSVSASVAVTAHSAPVHALSSAPFASSLSSVSYVVCTADTTNGLPRLWRATLPTAPGSPAVFEPLHPLLGHAAPLVVRTLSLLPAPMPAAAAAATSDDVASDVLVATAGDDCVLKVWSAVSGRCLRTFLRSSPVTHVALVSALSDALTAAAYAAHAASTGCAAATVRPRAGSRAQTLPRGLGDAPGRSAAAAAGAAGAESLSPRAAAYYGTSDHEYLTGSGVFASGSRRPPPVLSPVAAADGADAAMAAAASGGTQAAPETSPSAVLAAVSSTTSSSSFCSSPPLRSPPSLAGSGSGAGAATGASAGTGAASAEGVWLVWTEAGDVTLRAFPLPASASASASASAGAVSPSLSPSPSGEPLRLRGHIHPPWALLPLPPLCAAGLASAAAAAAGPGAGPGALVLSLARDGGRLWRLPPAPAHSAAGAAVVVASWPLPPVCVPATPAQLRRRRRCSVASVAELAAAVSLAGSAARPLAALTASCLCPVAAASDAAAPLPPLLLLAGLARAPAAAAATGESAIALGDDCSTAHHTRAWARAAGTAAGAAIAGADAGVDPGTAAVTPAAARSGAASVGGDGGPRPPVRARSCSVATLAPARAAGSSARSADAGAHSHSVSAHAGSRSGVGSSSSSGGGGGGGLAPVVVAVDVLTGAVRGVVRLAGHTALLPAPQQQSQGLFRTASVSTDIGTAIGAGAGASAGASGSSAGALGATHSIVALTPLSAAAAAPSARGGRGGTRAAVMVRAAVSLSCGALAVLTWRLRGAGAGTGTEGGAEEEEEDAVRQEALANWVPAVCRCQEARTYGRIGIDAGASSGGGGSYALLSALPAPARAGAADGSSAQEAWVVGAQGDALHLLRVGAATEPPAAAAAAPVV